MRKLNLWLLPVCTLCAAFIVYQGVAFMLVRENSVTQDDVSDGSPEPVLAAARSCNVSLYPVQALNFGAVVRPSSGRAAISIDTVGDLLVDRNHSVGINMDKYAPSYGAVSLQGSGLDVGELFEVRFIVENIDNGVNIDNLVFRIENVSNLQSLETDTGDNTLTFKVLGSDVHASVFYGATLTVNSTIGGSVSPSLLIEINGEQPCNL
jgi:hypothetical protein